MKATSMLWSIRSNRPSRPLVSYLQENAKPSSQGWNAYAQSATTKWCVSRRSSFIGRGLSASPFFEDVVSLCCPDEGLRVLIVAVDVFSDSHDQLFEVLKDSAPQPIVCEVAKEAFHHVEP